MFLRRLKPTIFRVSTKLTLAYSLVLILSSTIIFSFLYFQIRKSLYAQEVQLLTAKTEEFQRRIQMLGVADFEQFYSFIPNYDRDANLLVVLWKPDSEPKVLHEPFPNFRLNMEDLMRNIRDTGTEAYQINAKEVFGPYDVLVSGRMLPDGSHVIVARSSEGVQEQLGTFQRIFWWILIPMAIAGFLGGLFLATRTLAPVRELIISMKKIEGGSLSTRVPLGSANDELEELKVLCNRMLDKIENLVNSLREAFDHLAHDIRTPVTRLRGRAEIALSQDNDLDSYREALQSCYENSDKILNFLQVLTDITEAENRSRRLKLDKRYISDLVKEMMNLYEIAFEEKNISVVQKLDSNDWAMVDPRLMSRVIANLLDNAHKYTPEGGEVVIETINQTENVVLRVTDTGPGIPLKDQNMIWEKLFRSDKSRSEYGMGLGLTYVKAVVEAHDGRVQLKSPIHDDKGTCFEVTLQKMS